MAGKKSGIFNKWFIICVTCNFLYSTAFYMSTPILTQQLMDMGETAAVAGFIAGIFSLLAIVFRPFAGFASDRTNRKIMVMVGLVIYALCMFGYGLATNATTILILRIIHSLGLCSLTTVFSVVAVFFVPEENTGEGVGYLTMSTALATAAGPAIASILLMFFNGSVTFIASGVVMLAAIALVIPLPSQTVTAGTNKSKKITINDFICLQAIPGSFTFAMFSFCAGITASFMIAVGVARGITTISLFFVISSLGAVLIRPMVGRLVDHGHTKPVMTACFLCETLCMVASAFMQSIIGVLLASIGRMGGQLTAQTTLQGELLRATPTERRGVVNSTFYMGIDIGQGLGAMLGGVAAAAFGYQGMFFSGLFALVLGLISYFIHLRTNMAGIAPKAE